MNVGQLSFTPARPPLDGQHHQIQGVNRLDLEPTGPAAARLVRRGQRLGHHALVPGGQRRVQEVAGGSRIRGDQPIDPVLRGHDVVERRGALAGRRVEQVDAVAVQDVEEEDRQRLGGAGRRDVDRPAEARRGDLEGLWPAVRT